MGNTTEMEVIADHCLELGEVIGPGDTHYETCINGATLHQVAQQFERMEALANRISDHCTVNKCVIRKKGSVTIDAMFDFDCTAEKLIFELYLR